MRAAGSRPLPVGTPTPNGLEQALERVAGRCREESFARGLYRALAGRRWRREDGTTVVVGPERAEELVNGIRRAVGYETMALSRSGGEGRLNDEVRDELAAQGWRSEPL